MTMRNPIYVPVFPPNIDPPLPPTKVSDPILFARFDAQIRALQQASATGRSLYGGIYAIAGSQLITGTPAVLALPSAYGPAVSVSTIANANAVTVLRAQDVFVRALFNFEDTTGIALTVALYRNGILLADSSRTPNSAAQTGASVPVESLVAANNGDAFTLYASMTGGTATLTYQGSLIVCAAGAGQGIPGPAGPSGGALIYDKSFADSPFAVPSGANTDVSVDTTGGDVELDLVNGTVDREQKTFRIRAGSHDGVVVSTSANILIQANPSALQRWRFTGVANVVTLTWIAAVNQWQSA